MSERTYHDIDGNEKTLWEMIRDEPEWAASRIRELERLEDQGDAIASIVRKQLDRVDKERAREHPSEMNAALKREVESWQNLATVRQSMLSKITDERDQLREQNVRLNDVYGTASKLNSEKNQKLSMKMVELRKLKHENEQLCEQNAALAAHVKQLQSRLSPSPGPMEEQPDGSITPVDPSDYSSTPEISLARVRSQAKADVLQFFLTDIDKAGWETAPHLLVEAIRQWRDKYYKQAKGIDHD